MVWPFTSSPSPDKKTPVDTPPDHTVHPEPLLKDPAAEKPTPEKKSVTAQLDDDSAFAELLKEISKDEDTLREEHFKTKYPEGGSSSTEAPKHDINRRLKEAIGLAQPRRKDYGDLAERRRRAEEELDREPEPEEEEVTDMRCLTYFDNMYYCYSVGGQFLNVYRYGALRDCREISADWRFCMRTKVLGETARRAAIARRFREKRAKVHRGPNSEDVWELRRGERDNVFWPKIEEVEGEQGGSDGKE